MYQHFSVACTSNANYLVSLVLNPTIVGTQLAFTSLANSCIEYCVTSTSASVVSGGTVIYSIVASASQEMAIADMSPSQIPIGSSITGVSDVIVLSVQRLTGTSEDFYGTLHWKEVY